MGGPTRALFGVFLLSPFRSAVLEPNLERKRVLLLEIPIKGKKVRQIYFSDYFKVFGPIRSNQIGYFVRHYRLKRMQLFSFISLYI